MRHPRQRSVVALLLLLVGLTAVEQPPPLEERSSAVIRAGGREIPGTIQGIAEDGTITFVEVGEVRPTIYQKEQYEWYKQPCTFAESVIERTEWLLARPDHPDFSGIVRRSIRAAHERNAIAEARQLAVQAALTKPGDIGIAEEALELIAGQAGQEETVLQIADAALQDNPRWLDGYEPKAEALQSLGRQEAYEAWIDQWLRIAPTAAEANRRKAEIAEAAGDLDAAMQAFLKIWLITKDPDIGRRYACLSLKVGKLSSAARTAKELAATGHYQADSQGILGSEALQRDSVEEALPLLEAAVAAGGLDPSIDELISYNLGVAYYRTDQRSRARRQWSGLQLPAAELAMAILQRHLFKDVAALPAGLQPVAQEHNLCIRLRHGATKGVEDLQAGNLRHTFLRQIAGVVDERGSEDSLRPLTLTNTPESLHWRLYGHLLAHRFDEAQKLVDELPADDGYAGAVRVFLAANDNDWDGAQQSFERVRDNDDAPRGYINRLAAEFDASGDQVKTYDFGDWTDGVNLRSGWQSENTDTGTSVAIADGKLVFEGTQRQADAITRAWIWKKRDRLRDIEAVLDIGELGKAHGGIELFDQKQQNGLAIGLLPDGSLGWRALTDGTWERWRNLGGGAKGGTLRLALSFDPRSSVVQVDIPGSGERAIGRNVQLTTGLLGIGFFGYGPPAEQWRLAAERLVIQLRNPQGGLNGAVRGGPRIR